MRGDLASDSFCRRARASDPLYRIDAGFSHRCPDGREFSFCSGSSCYGLLSGTSSPPWTLRLSGHGPARYYRLSKSGATVGFIGAMTAIRLLFRLQQNPSDC